MAWFANSQVCSVPASGLVGVLFVSSVLINTDDTNKVWCRPEAGTEQTQILGDLILWNSPSWHTQQGEKSYPDRSLSRRPGQSCSYFFVANKNGYKKMATTFFYKNPIVPANNSKSCIKIFASKPHHRPTSKIKL